MKLTIDVTDCRDCPCKHHHYGHGENFDYCSHPEGPKGYDNIINDIKVIPRWCPISDKTDLDSDEHLMKEAEKVVDLIMNNLYTK